MDTGTAGTGTDFYTGTGHFGKFGTISIPVPDTSVSAEQHQYRYRHFGKVGTTIPVPDNSVNSVRHRYRYRLPRYIRYDIDTGTGYFGKFGTTSMPVPPVPVWTSVPELVPVSIQHHYRYQTLRKVQYNKTRYRARRRKNRYIKTRYHHIVPSKSG